MLGLHVKPSLSRDIALMSIVIMTVLGMVSLWVAYQTFEGHSDTVISQLENESLRIDRALIVEIENSAYLLESLGRQISQIGPENVNDIANLLRSFNDDARKDDVFSWIDAEQKVVISSNRGILSKPVDVSDRDYIKKALADPWKVQIGRPVEGRVSEKWVLPICLGLTNYRGEHVGAILISVDIDALTQDLRKVIREAGITFAIFSKTLTPLTEPKENDMFSDYNAMTGSLTKIDFDKHAGGVLSRASLFKQDKHYVFFEKSKEYPYVILIGYDQKLGKAEVVPLLLPRIAEIVLIALFLVALLWIIRSNIIKPVEQLSGIVGDIARGKGYHPLPAEGPEEIEVLSRQIKKLDDYIKECKRIENEIFAKNAYLNNIKNTAQMLSKARVEFLSALAQELRLPASSIKECIMSVKDQHFGPLGNQRYMEQAHEIYKLSGQLEQMIDDIAVISDLEYGVVILDEAPINVPFAIHRALRQFKEYPQHKHIDIKLRIDETLPALLIDEDRFHQILVNLLTGGANTLEQGAPMVLESSIETGQNGSDEYVFMLKYNVRNMVHNEDFASVQMFNRRKKDQPMQIIRTEGINMALTRMLVTLHQGVIEQSVSHNNVCRIYIRFPSERLVIDGESVKQAS